MAKYSKLIFINFDPLYIQTVTLASLIENHQRFHSFISNT